MRGITVFSGTGNPQLAADICKDLGVPLEKASIKRFANDCLEVQLQAACRGRDVFIIQPLVPPVQENLVQLLLMLDAATGASAARITVVLPHYAYARSDKRNTPQISFGGRLVARLISAAGANRILTMTLHSPQVQGFFRIPVDQLHAFQEIAAHFRPMRSSNAVVVSPDFGSASRASTLARMLGISVAMGKKQRTVNDHMSIETIIGDVNGRDVIVLDDEIAEGRTVMQLLSRLREANVTSVRIACTHGLFTNGSLERLTSQDDVLEIVCTNTVATHDTTPKLTILSVAPALAKAIRLIHNNEPASARFH